jgi:hypothetical protein
MGLLQKVSWCVLVLTCIKLLSCGQVPARIEKLIAEKRYYAAVQLHLQSISMLDREGIQSVSTCMAS